MPIKEEGNKKKVLNSKTEKKKDIFIVSCLSRIHMTIKRFNKEKNQCRKKINSFNQKTCQKKKQNLSITFFKNKTSIKEQKKMINGKNITK